MFSTNNIVSVTIHTLLFGLKKANYSNSIPLNIPLMTENSANQSFEFLFHIFTILIIITFLLSGAPHCGLPCPMEIFSMGKRATVLL